MSVAHCPASNAKSGRPICPASALMAAGVRLGLATDGPISGNGMDMQGIVGLYPKLQKVRTGNREAVPARDAVRAATLGGAEALGLGGVTGSIEAGKKADMILVDTDAFNIQPVYDWYATVAYAMRPHNVDTVLVDGRVVRDRAGMRGFDEGETMSDMRAIAERCRLAIAELMGGPMTDTTAARSLSTEARRLDAPHRPRGADRAIGADARRPAARPVHRGALPGKARALQFRPRHARLHRNLEGRAGLDHGLRHGHTVHGHLLLRAVLHLRRPGHHPGGHLRRLPARTWSWATSCSPRHPPPRRPGPSSTASAAPSRPSPTSASWRPGSSAGARARAGASPSATRSAWTSSPGTTPSTKPWVPWVKMGIVATDMEAYALYCNAAWLGGKALAMFAVSDLGSRACT